MVKTKKALVGEPVKREKREFLTHTWQGTGKMWHSFLANNRKMGKINGVNFNC